MDVAALIAQAILEENKEAAYKALAGALLKGNAYVFKELADRAYGKVKETIEHTGGVTLSLEQIDARLLEIVKGVRAS